MNGIAIAAILVGGTGIVIGLLLGVAGKAFYVEVDPREVAVREALPGNNCGGCGFPGCDGLAAAIAKGEAPVDGCPVGGSAVGDKVAQIMGLEAGSGVKKVAFVHCAGDCESAVTHYNYIGVHDCAMAKYAPNGGEKKCPNGCLGFGNCVNACPFGAIDIINGIAVVNEEKCKACSKCVAACPQHLISLVPYQAKVKVKCANENRGKVVMDACNSGCITCTLCAKNCPKEAIEIINCVPTIDYDKCVGCKICKSKCPKKVII